MLTRVTTRLWVKQYGLERSGTNYAKALLEMSCPDVRVLATVLGSKHYPPDLDHHVALLERGDVGIAVTDLQPCDYPDIVDAYRQRRMGVLLCVRDAVTWADAFERHQARRQKRDPVLLDRDALSELVRRWVGWIHDMSDWSRESGMRTTWAVHHQVVRDPQDLVDRIGVWGGRCGPAVEVGYLRKAGDHHGSENVTRRPYRPHQYRDIYAGEGQIRADDVDWLCDLVREIDDRGIAVPFLWDRRPWPGSEA